MSLCMVFRLPNGATLMSADTAISTQLDGQMYRLSALDDEEKIIEHNGTLVYCAGELEKCRKIRSYIRNMGTLNIARIEEYARCLLKHDTSDDNTCIIVCLPDGDMVEMLSSKGFQPTPIPWCKDRVDIFAVGSRANEAYGLAAKYSNKFDRIRNIAGNVYNDLLCEEIGSHLHLYSRRGARQPWVHARYVFNVEPQSIKSINATC